VQGHVGKLSRIQAFSVIASGAEVGEQVQIGSYCLLEGGARVGSLARIGDRVTLPQGTVIGQRAVLEAGVAFSDRRPRPNAAPPPTRIGDDARIGANATIRCGVSIGRGAEVEPGAVVDADVPDYALISAALGMPTGWRCTCGQALDLPLTGDGHAACSCGRTYLLEGGRVTGYSAGGGR